MEATPLPENMNPVDYWLGGRYEELMSSWEWSDGSTCMFFN